MKLDIYTFEPKQQTIEILDITVKQAEYINKIEQYKKENRDVPTIREICKLVNCSSTGTVKAMLDRLNNKYGYDYRRRK